MPLFLSGRSGARASRQSRFAGDTVIGDGERGPDAEGELWSGVPNHRGSMVGGHLWHLPGGNARGNRIRQIIHGCQPGAAAWFTFGRYETDWIEQTSKRIGAVLRSIEKLHSPFQEVFRRGVTSQVVSIVIHSLTIASSATCRRIENEYPFQTATRTSNHQ